MIIHTTFFKAFSMKQFLAKLMFLKFTCFYFGATSQKEYGFDLNSTFYFEEDTTAPFIWTLGIPSLNISVASEDDLCQTAVRTVNLRLYLVNKTTYGKNILLFPNGMVNKEAYTNGSQLDICCISWDKHDFSAIALLPEMTKEFESSTFHVAVAGSTGITATIHLQECVDTVDGTDDEISVTAIGSASYEEYGNCTCSVTDSELYHESGTKFVGKAQCNALTKWNGCQEAECWYAPSNATVEQQPIYSGKRANFNCDYVAGFPTDIKKKFFIGVEKREVTKNEALYSSDHNKEYYCTVSNNYTRITDTPDTVSIKRKLEVYFEPESLSVKPLDVAEKKQIYINISDSTLVTFSFRANAASGGVNAFSVRPNEMELTAVNITNDTETAYFYFFYNIIVESSNDYGFYVFTANTTDPPSSPSVFVEVLNSTMTTPDNDNIPNNTLAIAVGCGAGFLVILLIVVLIIYRRRKGKSETEPDIKEERENPLYGSTPGPPSNDAYAPVDKNPRKNKKEKEEKVNPLYQGTSTSENMVEEAYAAIDTKKKKGKKDNAGNENSAFAEEVTYAAVNKPKKHKKDEPQPDVIYSAVQKKKKNGQPSDADLHS